MEFDEDKIDDAVLTLLWLTLHDERRAWKGFDWGALGRLHQKGLYQPLASVTHVGDSLKGAGVIHHGEQKDVRHGRPASAPPRL